MHHILVHHRYLTSNLIIMQMNRIKISHCKFVFVFDRIFFIPKQILEFEIDNFCGFN